MAWSEFWGFFTKYLLYFLLSFLATIKAVILLLVAVGCLLGLGYLVNKYSQAKKKNREKNGATEISRGQKGEESD